MSRILAIDFGRKRIGLAISDDSRIAITNLPQLAFNAADFWQQLDEVINANRPGLFLVGRPDNAGSRSSLQGEIDNFIRHLQKRHPKVPIEQWDESYTSVMAADIYQETKGRSTTRKKQQKRKEKIDSLAAHLLLRSYLDNQPDVG